MHTSESPEHLPLAALQSGLELIRQSPTDEGVLALIVRRPKVGVREVLEAGELDRLEGLVGDDWKDRWNTRQGDGSPNLDTQLTVMNARVAALLARRKSRWPLAGDQLFFDLDLSEANAPAGTRLSLGSAVIEVTREPHTGCGKFVERFGPDAAKFVNSGVGRELHLRGIYAKVVQAGVIHVGDVVRKTS